MDCIVFQLVNTGMSITLWNLFLFNQGKSLSIAWFTLVELLSSLEGNLESWFYSSGNRDQPNPRLDLKVLSSSLFVGIFCNIINVPNCAGLSLKHRVMHSFSSQRYLEKSVFVLGNYSDRKQIKIRVVLWLSFIRLMRWLSWWNCDVILIWLPFWNSFFSDKN